MMFIKLEKIFLFLVLLSSSVAAPIDDGVGIFVLSNEEPRVSFSNASSNSQAYERSASNQTFSVALNITLPPVLDNTTSFPSPYAVSSFTTSSPAHQPTPLPRSSSSDSLLTVIGGLPDSVSGAVTPSNRKANYAHSHDHLTEHHSPSKAWSNFNAAAAGSAGSWKVNKHEKNQVKTQQLAKPSPTLFSKLCPWCYSSIKDRFVKFLKKPIVEAAHPGVAEPVTTQPAVVYPRVIYPGVVYPGVVYPGVVYPGVVYPAVAYPGLAHPDAVGNNAHQSVTGCGVPRVLKRSRRIVNGTVSRLGQWPWMVNIASKHDDGHTNICGGSLVTDRHVVTAAHCSHGVPSHLIVILGSVSRWTTTEGMDGVAVRGVRAIRKYHQTSDTPFANDIAIIELEHPVTFTEVIHPICLPVQFTNFLGSRGIIAGWGKLYEGASKFSSSLREASVTIISQERCLQWYSRADFTPVLRPEFMCAGHELGGTDACGGDSGSPLMVQDEWGRWVLAGIVSHGFGCAEAYKPGIYINTSYYLHWINEQLTL